jgi:hypothetical protein
MILMQRNDFDHIRRSMTRVRRCSYPVASATALCHVLGLNVDIAAENALNVCI